MTIICYRDGIIAADTLISAGDARVGHRLKIDLVGGWLIGAAGNVAGLNYGLNWINAGAHLNEPLVFCPGFSGCLTLISPAGVPYHVNENSTLPAEFATPWTASGSGEDFALGALSRGASAAGAVEAAIECCMSCGGNVTWIAQDGLRHTELPKKIYSFVNSS